MKDFLHRVFKWDVNEIIMDTIGVLLFAFSINAFIEPSHLYSGGVLGLSQLLNNLFNNVFKLGTNVTSIV